MLPTELQPLMPPGQSELLTVDMEQWGGSGPLFTAPHGVNLERDDKPDHLPEDFTTYLARACAASTSGSSLSWPVAALALVTATEAPLPGARDPNYLLFKETEQNSWVVALRHGLPDVGASRMHFDVHGKRDLPDERDCDVGVGAVREHMGDEAADAVALQCSSALERVLDPAGFSVDNRPRLQGAWRSVLRCTLTQSSVRLGYTCVQLELGYRLRQALGRDRALCMRVAAALAASAPACIAACRRVRPPEPPHTPLA
ncbi:unnamed protein product [Polarella glacialis]|uniref:Uncharacterized protein n=1 Tax=Polarella glacialis TaxID=89957 RepID=A0A813M1B6_POLGL|nr:unnamed protein product [Polarella glacialis]